ncbi:FecR family protein [Devosia faecipullorum]|uniref:FecR family protein n=1 Tax=Devosia faecipullorum TaxID=2755039 RepID=UPI00187BA681|nr:FecR family protein [Devosia faecipullorum]MBE7734605.1 FecR domain-containing protein [Devosia faecipullorum]
MLRVLLLALTCLVANSAFAADWIVDRLRGEAFIQANGLWMTLDVGMAIPNGVQVKTGSNGRVDLVRGAEKVTLGAGTQIQIRDAGSEMMTSITQTSGELVADVERRNVQHFSVQTPFLAAVVKGTKFVVTVDRNGATVDVERGVVQVQDTDHGLVADVQRGQQATVTTQSVLEVQGGSSAQVYTMEGVPVSANTASSINGNGGNNGNGNGNGGNNGNGKGKGNSGGD